MINDRLKEEHNRSLSDSVSELSGAAIALGALAAFGYRSLSAKYLSAGIDKTVRFSRKAYQEVASKAKKDWSSGEISHALGRLRGELNSIDVAVETNPISLRADDQRSFFGYVNELTRMQNNPRQLVNKMFDAEKLTMPTWNYYKNNHVAQLDKLGNRRMENFISGLAMNMDSSLRIANHIKNKNLQGLEIDIAMDLVDYMKSQNTLSARNRFLQQNPKYIRHIERIGHRLADIEDTFGTATKKSRSSRFFDKVLNDQAATIEDLLKNKEKIQDAYSFSKDANSFAATSTIKQLERLKSRYERQGPEQLQRFLKITPDPYVLRKNESGEIYSFKAASKLLDGVLDFAAGTLPGRLLKLRDLQYAQRPPLLHYSGKGALDPIMSAKLGSESSFLTGHFFRILGKEYLADGSGLRHVPELDQTYLLSGRYGSAGELIKKIMGHDSYKEHENSFLRTFDIGQSGQKNLYADLKSRFDKIFDEDWRRSKLNSIVRPQADDVANYLSARGKLDKSYALAYLNKSEEIDILFRDNTYELSDAAVSKLLPSMEGRAKEYLEKLLLKDDEQLIESLLAKEGSVLASPQNTWLNKDLLSLVNKYANNPQRTKEAISLKTDRSLFFGIDDKESASFGEQLRIEIAKEAFLQKIHRVSPEDPTAKPDYAYFVELIGQAGLTGKDAANSLNLAHWASFQKITEVSNQTNFGKGDLTARRLWNKADSVFNLLGNNDDIFSTQMQKTVGRLVDERTSRLETYKKMSQNLATQMHYGDRFHMQEAIGPLTILKSLNDKEKLRANGSKFFRQFIAGREDPENITTATLFPYFFLSRLSDGLNELGLGFSAQSSGSVLELAKQTMLKRILPATVAYNYFDWLDDTAQALTGTGLTASAANGIANLDLAMRKGADTVGLTGLLKSEKAANPIMQYWFEKDEFQSYEERRKYYEKGYDRVRKGRYWIFASANEFRGGSVAYWEPNFVRRANSDYYDKTMYEGYFDKWSHSLLPTPANPVSPMIGLLDPYWLENRHSKDRPYPVTGSMFSEGTPWGAVLNPTIGELVKPKKLMHTDRLQEGIDIKALIYAMNKQVYEKSERSSNLVSLKDGKLSMVKHTALAAPTMTERVVSINSQLEVGEVNTIDEYGQSGESSDFAAHELNMLANNGSKVAPLGWVDKIQLELVAHGLSIDLLETKNSSEILSEIQKINEDIVQRGKLYRATGVITPSTVGGFKKSRGLELLNDAETVQSLINESTGSSFVRESALSMRLITGIYGYGAHELFGFGNSMGRKIATSEDMTSPFRTFWDSGFAGFSLFGVAETLEIARRFVPDFKRNSGVNPLINSMPDWMPERFRFGDPYTVVPKGEMRIPGQGYESLNPLHPDQFGEYGAFDRYKILADIAPYSAEYKVWKDIAQRTVKDPLLLDELQDIKDRVAEQSKTHDFYNYRFLGQDAEYNNVTVTEVLNNGRFKIHGSDEVYRVAGIKVQANENNLNHLNEYLNVGQNITIARNKYASSIDNTIGAAVFAGGVNVGETMIETGTASRDKGDYSAAANISQYSGMQMAKGALIEAIAHLDVPLLSDRFLRIRSPLESYRAEQVYGTPYQTWSDIVGSYIMPAVERSVASETGVLVGQAAGYLHSLTEDIPGISPTKRKMFTAAYGLANRGAFIGGALAYIIKPNSGSFIRQGARAGSLGMLAGQLYVGLNSPIESAVGFSRVGYEVASFLKKSKLKGASIGAVAGLAVYGQSNSFFAPEDEWIPERTQRKWDLQEYFDRLSYLKYMGLYKNAAQKALSEEGVDIENIIAQQEEEASRRQELREQLSEAKEYLNKHLSVSAAKQKLDVLINQKFAELKEHEVFYDVGPWAQSALLYKEAAESTYYGLKDNASWSQAIRSLPKNDREYFMAMVSESDPEEREKILQVASPMLKRLLNKQWGAEVEELESNESFFESHNLPLFTWAGWRPEIDLQDVQVKTIYNEGMLLADFGFYESQLRDPQVVEAPYVNVYQSQNSLLVKTNLIATLQGLGLTGVDVSVQPAVSGISVIANVATIARYNMKNSLDKALSLL